jgi:hypothetical protein
MSSKFRGSYLGGGSALSEESIREEGFAIFKNGMVRRLSPTHYAVKSQTVNGWHLVELKDGTWICDCNSDRMHCPHVYSTQLHRYTSRQEQEEPNESHLKCRYCGSIDVAGCGFRYGARGISRRYFCRDCQRKFSIPYVQASPADKPSELAWLLNELGMLTTRLNQLISQLNLKLDSVQDRSLQSTENSLSDHPEARTL